MLGGCSNGKEGESDSLAPLLGIIDTPTLDLSNPERSSQQIILLTAIYVDGTSGNDNFQGTRTAPYRSITKAASVATKHSLIYVAPGQYYDREKFPIKLPDGVALIGNEGGKGNINSFLSPYRGRYENHPNTGPTSIRFNHNSGDDAAFEVGNNTIIAGFDLPNPIKLTTYGVQIRNNTISKGIYISDLTYHSGGHTISGNFIGAKEAPNYNHLVGIFFDRTTHFSKVEYNTIYRNKYGVVIRPDALADLGGGELGSKGHNIISCSKEMDLVFQLEKGKRLFAQNTKWDHNVPTYSTSSTSYPPPGIDIYAPPPTGTMDIFGYSLAPNACD
ncbi:PF07602 family protein [Leptospira weilii serovar Ranarum str. ICFT]|uniref:PF07602 family protein n=1 Tax=Leptospira weilii serovar Ranarum str. ICFT TaxID=1218598 RepID=N1WP30_9LEPT|nr:PF07602 family protein [Leptospira weilii serovar Ranarum str. ICFT]